MLQRFLRSWGLYNPRQAFGLNGRRAEIMQKIVRNCKAVPSPEGVEGPCWEWQGGTSGNGRGGGYGRVCISGGTMAVHRVVYQIIHGPIPNKKQIDHKCKNRLCCNPQHLEMVTHKENQKRRDAS